jgi:glycosyltransferase involved in cell wall biosynthesis
LLAWYFPPTIFGGTYRPLSVARYAAEAGLRVSVIAGPKLEKNAPAAAYLLSTLPASVAVAHTAPLESNPFSWAAPDLDGEKGWLEAVRTFATARKLVRASPPSVVIASGPPFHSFVSGFFLARRFAADLILDYRDEWTECPFDFVGNGPSDRRWEARCLGAAKLVIFTTRSQLEHQVSTFPNLDPDKCRVVPNGWEPEDFGSETRPDSDRSASMVTASFVGNLGDHCLPGSFLKTLEAAVGICPELEDKVRVRFAGQKSERAREELRQFTFPSMVESIPPMPKPAALDLMHSSSALLLLNYRGFERYIPGKLYEYIAAGRPILVFGDGGECASIVRELDAGVIVCEGDGAGLAGALSNPGEIFAKPKSRSTIEGWLSRHTRRELALRIVGLLRA